MIGLNTLHLANEMNYAILVAGEIRMKTTKEQLKKLKDSAKKEMGVKLDIPLWGKVKLFSLAASFNLKTTAVVSPFNNGTWGVGWTDIQGSQKFIAFNSSCFKLSHTGFIRECFGVIGIDQKSPA